MSEDVSGEATGRVSGHARAEAAVQTTSARGGAHDLVVSLSVSAASGTPVVTLSGSGSDAAWGEVSARLEALADAVAGLRAEQRLLRELVEGLVFGLMPGGEAPGEGLEPRGEVTAEQAQLEAHPDTPRPGERPARDALIDAWLEAVARERGEAQEDAEDEKTKPMTLYLSEETRRLLSIGKALGVGSMSEQVDALVRERMRGREAAE